MVKYFLNPFGTSGDKTTIPNDVQVSGSVSYASGWGLDYQKNLATDPTAKAVPRAQTNQLMYDITTNIQQYQQHGVPEFITTADNGGVAFPYSKYAIVRYDDGVNGFRTYQSLVDTNSTLPTNTTNWRFLDPDAEFIPVGTIIDYAGTSPPAGYLACTGTVGSPVNVSRTTYAALFSAIGTTWGAGDGSTTFSLPPCARRASIGSGGTSSGTIGNTVGSTGGEETHTLTIPEIPSHTHPTTQNNETIPSGSASANHNLQTDAQSGVTGPTGGGGAHNNIQPSMVVLRCIKF